MKRQLVLVILFLAAVTGFSTADNLFTSLKLEFTDAGTTLLVSPETPAGYGVVNTAVLYGNPSEDEIVPKACADLGWKWDNISVFGRFDIAVTNEAYQQLDNSLSESYYSTGGSGGGTYTAYDKISFKFYEFTGSVNGMYDLIILGESEEDFRLGVFAAGGGGVSVTLGADAGAYEVDSWPDTYTGDGSPSPSYNKLVDYTGGVSMVVPFFSAELGLNFYLNEKNPFVVCAGADIYPTKRFTGDLYIQDADGNAGKTTFIENMFQWRISAGYTFNF